MSLSGDAPTPPPSLLTTSPAPPNATQNHPPTTAPSHPQTLRIGTRASALALYQARVAHDLLSRLAPHLQLSTHPSSNAPADLDKVTALYSFNAKSLWTSELELQLLQGRIDLIVHSLKDMPTQLAAGCKLGAVVNGPGGREWRDCVVMRGEEGVKSRVRSLRDLQPGAVVGTSSVRRQAQLRRLYPELKFADMRGNVPTRLSKMDAEGSGFACCILAAAGVQRLGLGDRISSFLDREKDAWYAAVGQGALGIEIREGDERVEDLVRGVMAMAQELQDEGETTESEGNASGKDHTQGIRAYWQALTERSCLRTLEGGCSVPIGVETEWIQTKGESSSSISDQSLPPPPPPEDPSHSNTTSTKSLTPQPSSSPTILRIHATVLSIDGQKCIEAKHEQAVTNAEEAEEAGLEMARKLIGIGAEEILKEILLNRGIIKDSGGA
ncbi:porphobilinogen deaminase [Agyrium rufum]|nr:porphobilinogen deaminase [Agyrium rufum]